MESVEQLDGACAVCHRVLDWESNKDGTNGHWVHTFQDREHEDHAPVRVPEDAIATVPRCDFCNTDYPTFEVPSRSFDIPLSKAVSVSEWACCEVCAKLITDGKWGELIERAMDMSPTLAAAISSGEMDRMAVRLFLQGMYGDLRASMTGPPIQR